MKGFEQVMYAALVLVISALVAYIFISNTNLPTYSVSKPIESMKTSFELVDYGIVYPNTLIIYLRPTSPVNISDVIVYINRQKATVKKIGDTPGDIVDPNKGDLIIVSLDNFQGNNVNILVSGVNIISRSFSINLEEKKPVMPANITRYFYRIPINITERSGSNLADYQVLITINTQALISAGKMRSDCGDIRFTDANRNPLSYWIESGCNTTNTKIWVKVPFIPANGQVTIYMYYGNPSATSESSGVAVFEWFDTFDTNTLTNYDHLTGLGWHPIPYSVAGSCTFTYDSTNKRLSFNCPDNYMSALSPKTNLLPNMTNLAVSLRVLFTAFGDGNAGISIHVRYINIQNNYYIALSNAAGESELGRRVGGTDTVLAETNFAATTNTVYQLEFRIAGSRLEYWRNSSLVASATDTSITSAGRVLIYPSEASGWIDDVIIRKYTYPEPSVALGNEEITFYYPS